MGQHLEIYYYDSLSKQIKGGTSYCLFVLLVLVISFHIYNPDSEISKILSPNVSLHCSFKQKKKNNKKKPIAAILVNS